MNNGTWQCNVCLALMSAECTECWACDPSTNKTIKVTLPEDAEPCSAEDMIFTTGLVSRATRTAERINEIKTAIVQMFEDHQTVPLSWLEEYNELVEWTANLEKGKE